MNILDKTYSDEDIIDIEQDVYDAINDARLPINEFGFINGSFKVTIEFIPEK